MAQLCLLCEELFTQLDLEPRTVDSWEYPPFSRFKREVRSVLESAESGCRLCRVVLNKVTNLLGDHSDIKDATIGPRIYWDEEAAAFCNLVYRLDTLTQVYPELVAVALHQGTETGDLAPDCLRPSNSAEACRALATRWLLECTTHHQECRVRSQPSSWLPTRLIDIGFSWSTQDPKLIDSSSISTPSPKPLYIALSHRWGTWNMVRLTQANLKDFMQGISLTELPLTFQHAIKFSRDLGIRYMWIDSLCIIQDSKSDWVNESAVMGKVYEYSFLNIAATSASKREGQGLYEWRDPYSITPFTAQISWRGHVHKYNYFLDQNWYHSVSKAPLNTRGWVFQERLLSPRTLHFSSQLFWECHSLKACEAYPSGLRSEPSVLGHDIDQDFPPSTKSWKEELQQDPETYWDLLTQMFCRYYLTQPSDRLAAIAGIANQLQPLIYDEYCAGLWKRQLPHSLLWNLGNMVGQDDFNVTKPSKYRCPSWSWASLDFQAANLNILDRGGTFQQLAELIDVRVESDTGQIYNNVTGGSLVLRGKLGRVKLSKLTDAEWRGDRGGHYTFEFRLDVDMADMEDVFPYCLPILIHDRANPQFFDSLEVHCLLFQQIESDSNKFTRLGTLQVLLDWEAETIEELRWITDFVRGDMPLSADLDLVTVY